MHLKELKMFGHAVETCVETTVMKSIGRLCV